MNTSVIRVRFAWPKPWEPKIGDRVVIDWGPTVPKDDVGRIVVKSVDGLFVVDIGGGTYVVSPERLRPA